MKAPVLSFPHTKTIFAYILLAVCQLLVPFQSKSQSITGIFTDFNGYYASYDTALNNTKTTRSHNLIGFTYKGVRYSTGVKDSILATRGVTVTASNFRALPIASIGGTISAGSSTYILLPAEDDGVSNGTTTPYPSIGISNALTDGLKGLNLGSGVTNLPTTASLTFPVTGIDVNSVADSTPDIMYTQIAAIGGNPDTLYFINSSGVRVGDYVSVRWSSVPVVGSHLCDLYTLSNGAADAATINGVNASNQSKDYRLVAFRLSEFGITSTNAGSVSSFIIRPGGASDPAFVAYNVDAFTVLSTLPTKTTEFSAVMEGPTVVIRWMTAVESGSDHFITERSKNGQRFSAVDTISAARYSSSPKSYSSVDPAPLAGTSYYRLRQVDDNGNVTFSSIVKVTNVASLNPLNIYPNPAKDVVHISCSPTIQANRFVVTDLSGRILISKSLSIGNNTHQLITSGWNKGLYWLTIEGPSVYASLPFIIQ